MSNPEKNGKAAGVHGPGPPALAWERLAAAGRVADAIAAYVQHYDWVTFAELCRRFESYTATAGNTALELRPNVVVWVGMSETFAAAITTLIGERRVFMHPCATLSYMIDGGMLTMPLAKDPPPAGYTRPRWLPVALRVVPLRQGTRKGRNPKRSIEPRRKAARG
jgi:hypothetical protein